MDRLTKRDRFNEVCVNNAYPCEANKSFTEINTAVWNKLAEYEEAEEKGLLVRLQCKVGDKVYIIFPPFGDLNEWEITSIQIFEDEILFKLGHKGTDDYAAIWSEELGDRAFFTRPEAEKRLKELQDGKTN